MYRDRIDEAALQAARNLAASSPRADYTPGQLPALPLPVVTSDQLVVWRSASGQTYQCTVAQLAALITTPLVPPATATFTQNSFRNRIYNGGMAIDQRNNGTAVSSAAGATNYSVDRFSSFVAGGVTGKFTMQRAATIGPSAFNLTATSTSAYAPLATDVMYIYTSIEANNIQDFDFGTVNAKPVAVSFIANSSTGGVFTLSFQNFAGTRSYVTTYALPAGVPTPVSIAIPGDTAGAWVLSGAGGSASLDFGLGTGNGNAQTTSTLNVWQTGNFTNAAGSTQLVATNGATFSITALQLEVGTAATPFEVRPYGTELQLCQRYCYALNAALNSTRAFGAGFIQDATSNCAIYIALPVTMRANSTLSTIGTFRIANLATAVNASPPTIGQQGPDGVQLTTVTSTLVAGQACILQARIDATAQLTFSADY